MLRVTRLLFIPLLFLALARFGAAQTSTPQIVDPFQVLFSFSGPDGAAPDSIIQASDGFFYGATANGGDTTACAPDGCGTLFKMDGAGNVTVLHTFQATDGYLPTGLMEWTDGNFYGTTMAGGQPSGGGAGTIFRIDSAGNFTPLYSFVGGFACCDGAGPTGPPLAASDGNFYGTTGAGGEFRDIDHQAGFGTVYQFNPATNAVTIIHSFNLADGNGIFPNSPLMLATDGFFYGTVLESPGAAFKIDTAGNFSRVAIINGQLLSGLIQASDGLFYGSDEGGGGAGSIYSLDSAGTFNRINLFDGADGFGPKFRVKQASDGLLYGTTHQGGLLDFQGGDIFRLSTGGVLEILHSFTTTDGIGGFSPNSELIQATDGALFGVAGAGGANGRGTIFRFDPAVTGIVASVSVQPDTVVAGNNSTGTVTLSSPAPAGGTVVTLGPGSFLVVIPPSVMVPAGATTANFNIQTLSLGFGDVRIYASVGGRGVRTVLHVLPAGSCGPMTLSPASLPGGTTGASYLQTFSVTGGTAPIHFSFTGTLPQGLSLNATTGILSGTPVSPGTFNFTITATDNNSCSVSQNYSVGITCGSITLNPPALPAGTTDAPYLQTLTASGGVGSITFSFTGNLPQGLSLDSATGVLSGTPALPGSFDFTVTATDANACSGSQAYSVAINCPFCDEFDDGVLSPDWNYSSPASWSESNGELEATTTRKTTAIASPAFGGCTLCTIETTMHTRGGAGNMLGLFAWYQDSRNTIELLLKQDKNKWSLRQISGGTIVAKVSAPMSLAPGVDYSVRLVYDGSKVQLFVDGSPLATLTPAGPLNAGTVGFLVRRTKGSFDRIVVN